MGFFRKKESAIDRRIRDLQREMSRIDTDIKDRARLSRNAGKPADVDASASAVPIKAEDAPMPARRFPAEPSSPALGAENAGEAAESASADAAPAAEDVPQDRDDLFAHVRKGAPEDERQPDLFAASLPGSSQRPGRHSGEDSTDRERFANYFMAGHFQNLRPLRRERRMLRNRAILTLVLAVIFAVIVWKIYF